MHSKAPESYTSLNTDSAIVKLDAGPYTLCYLSAPPSHVLQSSDVSVGGTSYACRYMRMWINTQSDLFNGYELF